MHKDVWHYRDDPELSSVIKNSCIINKAPFSWRLLGLRLIQNLAKDFRKMMILGPILKVTCIFYLDLSMQEPDLAKNKVFL